MHTVFQEKDRVDGGKKRKDLILQFDQAKYSGTLLCNKIYTGRRLTNACNCANGEAREDIVGYSNSKEQLGDKGYD